MWPDLQKSFRCVWSAYWLFQHPPSEYFVVWVVNYIFTYLGKRRYFYFCVKSACQRYYSTLRDEICGLSQWFPGRNIWLSSCMYLANLISNSLLANKLEMLLVFLLRSSSVVSPILFNLIQPFLSVDKIRREIVLKLHVVVTIVSFSNFL